MEITTIVVNMMDKVTKNYTLLIDLGPIKLSEYCYESLAVLMQICSVAFGNTQCTTVVALSSGISNLYNLPKEHDTLQ